MNQCEPSLSININHINHFLPMLFSWYSTDIPMVFLLNNPLGSWLLPPTPFQWTEVEWLALGTHRVPRFAGRTSETPSAWESWIPLLVGLRHGAKLLFNWYLVGGFNTPDKYESQLGWLFPTEWENKKMFQTTNQHPLGKVGSPFFGRFKTWSKIVV